MISQLSPGSPIYLPHGMRIYNRLIGLLKKIYAKDGYDEVQTPMLYNHNLYRTSGHWDYYKQNMFLLDNTGGDANNELDNQSMGLKPMNCPVHCLIYKEMYNQNTSYRSMPVRLADFGTLHRNERLETLSGLSRVRTFHQDDAHIFCRSLRDHSHSETAKAQFSNEIKSIIATIKFLYTRVFNLNISFYLSTRPDKYIGELSSWDSAERLLKATLDESRTSYTIKAKEGAFYGPKIDVMLNLGEKQGLVDTVSNVMVPTKNHQTATIQVDFNLPERFELKYLESDGQVMAPVLIHRAVLGSLERFLAIYTEKIQGKWPLWLSPRQILVCPLYKSPSSSENYESINVKIADYANEIRSQLANKDLYVDIDDDVNVLLDKKIASAQIYRYNYIVTVGNKEMEQLQLSIRHRDKTSLNKTGVSKNKVELMTLADFIATLMHQIENYE